MKFTIASSMLFVLLFAASCAPTGNQNAPAVSPTAKPTIYHKAVTATATETSTPEPTPTKETVYKKITTDNFMEAYKDKSCFIDLEKDIFSGKYKEWRNTQKGTYDAFKQNRLAMFLQPNMYSDGAIAFPYFGKPNFDKQPAPMQNFILACTTFEGHNYLLITPEMVGSDHKVKDPHNVTGEDVIALQVIYPLFNDQTGANLTEAEVKQTVDLLSKMKVIPLLTGNIPEWTTKPDPLINESWKNFPDIQKRFENFAAHNNKWGHYEALDDPKLFVLTTIDVSSNGGPSPASQ